jgi:hypothetical protein
LETAEQYWGDAAKEENDPDLVEEARAFQEGLADPYFEMCFRLFEARSAELLLTVLELQRQQYRTDYLELRLRLLTALRDRLDDAGDHTTAAFPRAEADLLDEILDRIRRA